jgi:hypothetical protein
MALQVKTRLTPSYDWKSILVEDTTGTGITGYGSNQSPTGYRESATAIIGRIIITSPSDEVKTINLNSSQIVNVINNGYTIDYSVLGLTIDDYLEDGLWKIEYNVGFNNDFNFTDITVNSNLVDFTYISGCIDYFRNNAYFYIGSAFQKIASLNFPLLKGAFSNYSSTSGIKTVAHSIYSTTLYVPIAREIKECLDGKVADLSVCDCGCLELQTIKLVNMYLLYDAMFVNCAVNNVTKAQQIFDLLTTYCDKDCGCNS